MATVDGPDGLAIGYELRGDPRLVFVHANGFCKEVWHPVADELGAVGFVAIDQPGHGESDTPDPPFDWWDFARSVLAVIEAGEVSEPVGVGHSSGAATLAMAEILRPGTFRRLVLVEPVVPPPPYRRIEEHPLIEGALRRRRSFPSAEAAFRSYEGRGPFARWDDRALRAYVDHGFSADGDEWHLRCAPETEAEVYRTSESHGAWDRLGEITCPVDVVVGVDSDTHPEAYARRQTARLLRGTLHVIDRAGHFVPMERPEAVAGVIGPI